MKGRLPLARPLPEPWLRPLRGPGLPGIFVFVGSMAATLLALMATPTVGPVALLVALLGVIAPVGAVVSMTRRLGRQTGEAARLLHQGKNDEAEAAFVRIARTPLVPAQVRGITLFNLALTAIQRGDVERAVPLLQGAHTSRAARMQPQLAQAIPFLVALAYAAIGDIGASRAWMDEGRRRRLHAHLRHEDAVEAMLLAREKRYAEARDRLEETWLEVEACFSAGLMRALRVLRAFLVQNAGEAARAAGLVEGCRPFIPGEYAWLGAHWPEMQAFLAEHRLN